MERERFDTDPLLKITIIKIIIRGLFSIKGTVGQTANISFHGPPLSEEKSCCLFAKEPIGFPNGWKVSTRRLSKHGNENVKRWGCLFERASFFYLKVWRQLFFRRQWMGGERSLFDRKRAGYRCLKDLKPPFCEGNKYWISALSKKNWSKKRCNRYNGPVIQRNLNHGDIHKCCHLSPFPYCHMSCYIKQNLWCHTSYSFPW